MGGAVRVFKMCQMSASLFALNLVFFLWHSQGWGGMEGDSLGEWWVGAVGREMGAVALGWVAGPVHAAAQSKQARSQEWRCGDVAFLLLNFGGLMRHELGGRFCFHPCKFLFYFWFLDWVHLVFSKEKWF